MDFRCKIGDVRSIVVVRNRFLYKFQNDVFDAEITMVLWRGTLAAGRRLSHSLGGALGAADESATLPLVHFLVSAPELHSRALQHAAVFGHRLPGKM